MSLGGGSSVSHNNEKEKHLLYVKVYFLPPDFLIFTFMPKLTVYFTYPATYDRESPDGIDM